MRNPAGQFDLSFSVSTHVTPASKDVTLEFNAKTRFSGRFRDFLATGGSIRRVSVHLNGRQRRITTKATNRKTARKIAEEYEEAVRTERTTRQLNETLTGYTRNFLARRSYERLCVHTWRSGSRPRSPKRRALLWRFTDPSHRKFVVD
jgi:hypothetical protein